MTAGPEPRARKPAQAPSKADLDERDRYAKLTAGSIDTVRGSAQAWRTGLTAFITLVTTGVVIKGRDTTAGLASGWRALVTILIGGGLLLAAPGLWQALAAEACTDPKMHTLQDIRAAHGTLAAYEVYLAAKAARRLRLGRLAVAAAIVSCWPGSPSPGGHQPPHLHLRPDRGHRRACRRLRHPATGGLGLGTPQG